MRYQTRSITLFGLALLLGTLSVSGAHAESSFFNSDCAGCHNNDNPTCNGCHHHRGTLSATADAAQYEPGAPVTITLHGGTRGGWIRGLLYVPCFSWPPHATAGPFESGFPAQGVTPATPLL